MEKHTVFLFCALILTIATPTGAKIYRKDYVYDWRTDAFYKLHVNSSSELERKKVCEFEGAKLMSPMTNQELSQLHTKMRQLQNSEEDGDLQQLDPTESQSIIDYSESKDVLEMTCQVATRDGYVQTRSVFRDQRFFICKVEAKDVPHSPQCRLHAKGYRYYHPIGSCYKVSHVSYTWHQAAAECQAEGAHLAVINSEAEALLLKEILAPIDKIPDSSIQSHFHIGFRAVKTTEPRVFKTIFDETLDEAGFSNWATGEPYNWNSEEHCGTFYKNEGKLNDRGCHRLHAFVCEKEVICKE